jgi:hypothetical protein
MALKPFLTVALESALNNYIRLDMDVSELLSPLAGKVIGLTIEPFGETLYLCPTGNRIQVLDDYPGVPDTRISGSLWALGLMGISAKPMRSIFSGEVKIEGDITTGYRSRRKAVAFYRRRDRASDRQSLSLRRELDPAVDSNFRIEFERVSAGRNPRSARRPRSGDFLPPSRSIARRFRPPEQPDRTSGK